MAGRVKTFSKHFGLEKTQAELDFVDIPIRGDIALFVDPFALSQRTDRWSLDAHVTLLAFFEQLVEDIRAGKSAAALAGLQNLREPNETHLGLSKGMPRGNGIGQEQAAALLRALTNSAAVKTGLLSSMEECELMVEGIGRDKISDLSTNVLRGHLAIYTKDQCELHGINTTGMPLKPYYDRVAREWRSEYFELPSAADRPVLLVPKAIVRAAPAYDHETYYRHSVLPYLQAEALSANSSLVRTLKNGKRVVRKKDVAADFPCTKDNLFKFSRKHPSVLRMYRNQLAELERKGAASLLDSSDEAVVAKALSCALSSIQPGGTTASTYHNLMVGIVEFVFYPHLLYPVKENPIHGSRKRLDIRMENGARGGAFYRLHAVKKLPCAYVAFECKNYTTDVANPELDQLAGRFSPNRGQVGVMCCRAFDDRARFVERCRDTFKDQRGLIIPLDDPLVLECLKLIETGQRSAVDDLFRIAIDEVWVS
jgi:hypothetical protein